MYIYDFTDLRVPKCPLFTLFVFLPLQKDAKKDEKEEKKDSDSKADLSMQQSVAVIGLALVAMGEEIGSEMLFRTFGHLLRYCEPVIRRAVPLALGLISVSNPQLNILDTLSKFSHDSDPEVRAKCTTY